MRSWLFIEADAPNKLAKAPMVGADAVVLDLTAVAEGEASKGVGDEVASWLKTYSDPLIANKAFARWVRMKPLDAPLWRDELLAAMRGEPDGVIVPKITNPEAIRTLASELYEIEQKLGLKHNSTKIIPQVGETPAAALALAQLTGDRQPRLTGFAWNAENVARGLSAKRARRDDGSWTDAVSHVRAMTIILAKTMGIMAIETPIENPANAEETLAAAREAKQDGFTGMAATHPRQIAAINEAYSLSAKERAEAEALMGLFASKPKATPKTDADAPKAPAVPEEMKPKQVRAIT